jgi:hypothetical protein
LINGLLVSQFETVEAEALAAGSPQAEAAIAHRPRTGVGIMDVTFPEYQDAPDFEPKAENPTKQEDEQTPNDS